MSERPQGRTKRVVFSVAGMDCVTCSLAIGKRLRKLDGVKDVGSAVMLNKVFVDYDDSKTDKASIKRAIQDAGYSSYVSADG
ncbi:MAG: cation transporter [Nitrososphaerota archaeon]|jgi:Cu+-exporting ATPase|nr:cation transporter [Nitrososphaerota archaeon]MDG6979072.1 cation transporter [Nitrososphaerota archaeon]